MLEVDVARRTTGNAEQARVPEHVHNDCEIVSGVTGLEVPGWRTSDPGWFLLVPDLTHQEFSMHDPGMVTAASNRQTSTQKTLEARTRLAGLFLEVLKNGDGCVCELMAPLEIQQSRLSFHMKTLENAGLGSDRRDGRGIHYSVHPEALAEIGEAVNVLSAAIREPGPGCCDRAGAPPRRPSV